MTRRDKTVLVIGSGAREHALALALARSAHVGRVLVAPGNALCDDPRGEVPILRVPDVTLDADELLAIAARYDVDLTVVGPEGPLAAGLVDRFEAASRRIFGPTRRAAEIETSKAFSKAFMQRHGIPTAQGRAFSSYHEARVALAAHPLPVVLKASGLAAGKGVFICKDRDQAEDALWRTMEVGDLGPAGREVLIEEHLEGPEVSVLAITDGDNLLVLPPVRDHKRLRDGDHGPNTGGMGAFSPVPGVDAALMAHIRDTILAPAVRGLAAEGRPFCGVLYAGVMLTEDGPRCLEFNARFGDPEAECILPLITSDLYELIDAALDHRLAEVELGVSPDATAAVVLAAPGYPDKVKPGSAVFGLEAARAHAEVYGGAIELLSSGLSAIGGRVLTVVGRGHDLRAAVARAYAAVDCLSFEGMQFRRDIARSGLGGPRPVTYADAGVDIEAGINAVSGMKAAVESTFNPFVLSRLGGYAGLFSAKAFAHLEDPVLVASTDGVGTKTMVARQLGRWDTIGRDLVGHSINDILVVGARPLFFLDYVASGRLDSTVIATVVQGLAHACREHGIALLGGETAEMPGVYHAGEVDLAGTIVGVVDRQHLIDGSRLAAGHRVFGLRSNGLHTNGYSLARRVLDDLPLDATPPGFETTLGEALLATHRPYLSEIETLWSRGIRPSGLVHITGGGFVDNPPRILPAGLAWSLDLHAWERPPLFRLIAERGHIPEEELRRVFNLGMGLLVALAPNDVGPALAALPELLEIGSIIARPAGSPPVVFA